MVGPGNGGLTPGTRLSGEQSVELGQENELPREEEACVAESPREWKPEGGRQQKALGTALPGVFRGHLLPVKVVEDRPRQLFQMIGVNL